MAKKNKRPLATALKQLANAANNFGECSDVPTLSQHKREYYRELRRLLLATYNITEYGKAYLPQWESALGEFQTTLGALQK